MHQYFLFQYLADDNAKHSLTNASHCINHISFYIATFLYISEIKIKYSLLLFELILSRRIFSSSSAQRHSLFILFTTRIRFPFVFIFANGFVYIYARRVIMSASEMSESKTQEKRNEVTDIL